MGIFDRLSTLIRSNITDLINRAENPEKMLNQLIVDMRSQLAKAKQQVAAAIADEKRSGDTLVKQFQSLEVRADADQQLIELKRKMGLLPAASAGESKQLGKGAAEAELVEDDDAPPPPEHHR